MTTVQDKQTLYELGVEEMAAGVADGSITPLELAEALLARIQRYDGKVRAFSHMERETILIEAEALTAEAKAGKLRGPLHGVPFGVKEQFLLEGVQTLGDWADPTWPKAKYDATVITRLKEAGALLFGKLYMVGSSGTPPSRNPWNLEYTPGGSSSGSGAAVGARMLPFALAEQTGGSGLRPAAYCGISAMKPTYGRNSRFGMFQLIWSTDHACIIGTTIKDVAKVFSVTAGYDPKDPSSVNLPPPTLEAPLTRAPRIGIVRNFFPEFTLPEMQAAIEASAQKLAAAGAEVVDFYLPEDFGLVWPVNLVISGSEGAVINMREESDRKAKGLAPRYANMVTHMNTKFTMASKGEGSLIPAPYYLQAQRVRRMLADKMDAAMAPFDAILMATAPGAAPHDPSTSGDPTLLTPWSLLGNPAINIPAATLSSEGMPLGLQLVAPRLADEHLLATGAWCEDTIGRLPIPEMAF